MVGAVVSVSESSRLRADVEGASGSQSGLRARQPLFAPPPVPLPGPCRRQSPIVLWAELSLHHLSSCTLGSAQSTLGTS